MPATIEDVAKLADVSIKTVSRVINNEPFVAEATRAKVMTAMQELGYAPNISAQRLASGRSRVIGLVSQFAFHNITWDYVNSVQLGVLEECRKHEYGMLINPCDSERPEDQQGILRLVAQRKVDGFILIPPADNSTSLLEELQARRIPFVRLAPRDRQSPWPYVTPDDRQGAYDMTQHLLSQGHKRIGFIIGDSRHQASHDRLAGFRDALEAHKVQLDATLVQQGDFTFASGIACGRALLEARPRPTAIFAGNDNMAVGVLAVAHQLGISVPEDLSVAGFDDVPLAQQLWPPLTTVRQPIRELAQWATGLLIDLIEETPLSTAHHVLATELVIRESTGQCTSV
jgi:LacI family transcriptional regulator